MAIFFYSIFSVCKRGLILLVLLHVSAVMSQELSVSSDAEDVTFITDDNKQEIVSDAHPLQLEMDELWISVLETEQDVILLREQLQNEKGDKASLFFRLTQRQLEMLDIYSDITVNIKSQQDAALNVDDKLMQLKERMLPIGPRARRSISRQTKSLQADTLEFESLSDEAIHTLGELNYYTNIAYQAMSQHSQNLLVLGFNNEETAGYLKEFLYARGESLYGQIQLSTAQRDSIESDLAFDRENDDLQAQLRSAHKRQNILTGSLRKTIELMDENAIDSSIHMQLLIRTTGELTTDIFKPTIFIGLIGNWFDRSLVFIKNYSSEIAFKAIIFLGLLLIFYYLSRFVGKITRKAITTSSLNVSVLMEEMLVSMTARIVFIIGFLIALGQIGVSLAPVLAGLGVAGFIVGFALQDTLSNFASGVMILVYRPYDVGDMIEAGAVKGNVKSMNLVSTTVLTIDHQTLVIPNNKIWGDVINNLTAQKVRRVDMTFKVAYSEKSDRIEKILTEIIEDHPKTLSKPQYLVKLHELSESSVNFIVRPWVRTDDYWEVYWDITRAVKDRFDEEGIRVPFPQRDVHVYQNN